MRESYGGTWITALVLAFTLIFSAFLALSINYSKAFRVKNEVMTIIEKKGGATDDAIQIIGNYLINNGYTLTHKCKGYKYGVIINGINSAKIQEKVDGKEYSFCVNKVKSVGTNFPNKAFYEVKLFFKFNLPVLGEITTFEVKGQTKDVSYPLDGNCGDKLSGKITICNNKMD